VDWKYKQNKNATFLRFIKCFPLLYVGYTDSPVASVALKHVYVEESLINPVRVFPFLEPWRWIISWWSRSLSCHAGPGGLRETRLLHSLTTGMEEEAEERGGKKKLYLNLP